jgi:GNAT superfamily N-acetyltransferase
MPGIKQTGIHNMQEWITDEHIDANVLQAIKSGVIDTGRELARSYGGHAQPIACAMTERSSLIGGATGRTEFNRLFIDYLWIAPQWRLRGLASEALHKIEALAAQRGCIDAIIETLDDDIAQWYQRAGYVPIAQVPGYCGPWSRHTLLKPHTCPKRNGIGKGHSR